MLQNETQRKMKKTKNQFHPLKMRRGYIGLVIYLIFYYFIIATIFLIREFGEIESTFFLAGFMPLQLGLLNKKFIRLSIGIWIRWI